MIRKAVREDIMHVYSLLCELEDKALLPFDSYKKIYTDNLDNPDIYYYVYDDGTAIVAFASLHIQPLLHHCSCVAEIQELVVKNEYKGKGIGKRLVSELIRTAQENGCSLIEVCCNQKRTQSHIFYEHCGMKNTHFKFTLELE